MSNKNWTIEVDLGEGLGFESAFRHFSFQYSVYDSREKAIRAMNRVFVRLPLEKRNAYRFRVVGY